MERWLPRISSWPGWPRGAGKTASCFGDKRYRGLRCAGKLHASVCSILGVISRLARHMPLRIESGMPDRRRVYVPKYRLHKPTKLAVVRQTAWRPH